MNQQEGGCATAFKTLLTIYLATAAIRHNITATEVPLNQALRKTSHKERFHWSVCPALDKEFLVLEFYIGTT